MNDVVETKVKITDRKLLSRLFMYAKGQEGKFVLAIFLMLIAVGIDLLLPILIGRAAGLLDSDVIDFTRIIYVLIAYAICLVISNVTLYFQSMILQKTGQTIIYKVREDVFSHIEKFSANQFNNVPVGKLVTRVTNDTNTLNELYTSVIINLLKNIFSVAGALGAMFLLHKTLTLYILLLGPVLLVISYIFRKISRRAYREVRNNLSDVNAFLSENLSGMKVTQIFNQEKKKMHEFEDRNAKLKKSSLKEIFVFAVFRPSIYVIYISALVMILWFSGEAYLGNFNIIKEVITIQLLITFIQLIDRLFNPIQQLAEQFNILQSAFASAEKIFSVLDTEPEIVDCEDSIELEKIEGNIEFKNVWFKYKEDEWVLKDVSFKINAKDVVAFVGATGSGKTTILSLIVRNYDIQKGQILIDGIDIKKIKISSLRKNIGQMLQDVFLFSGTIMSNIQMKEESITEADVIEACKYVNADSFIEELPNKYHEEVRERGGNFSSGQRQLLSFARTLVHKPQVMILDEATANIDTETEVLIQDSLEKMMNIGTMIIVAHRLSTIQHADKIIVLSKGEIVEEGTHQELLKKRGQYYKLYQLQYQKKEHKSLKEVIN
ncbi:MAG TPA: ABC transporter ATP-binding protein [Acholeplasmataceae bacterium]|nr:ABC transporter ATP-binding protein [Acholeplasmataceae bacterium]